MFGIDKTGIQYETPVLGLEMAKKYFDDPCTYKRYGFFTGMKFDDWEIDRLEMGAPAVFGLKNKDGLRRSQGINMDADGTFLLEVTDSHGPIAFLRGTYEFDREEHVFNAIVTDDDFDKTVGKEFTMELYDTGVRVISSDELFDNITHTSQPNIRRIVHIFSL